ncbi:MAG: RNA-binding protein [Bacteroidetes bacterium]|nr:MAG: RNA-binding protein [Bacteroidota bacterium]
MRKRDNMKSIRDVIDKVLQLNNMHSKLDEVEVVLAWKEVFGDVIHKKTRHLMLQHDGTLLVTLNSGPLKEEFNHEKEKIVKMLNTHLKRDVVMRVRIR